MAFALGVTLVLWMNASPLLPGFHSDGVHYVGAAEALAAGDGPFLPVGPWDGSSERSFLSHYPPGFPAAIAALVVLGSSPVAATVAVLALSAGLTTRSTGSWPGRTVAPPR